MRKADKRRLGEERSRFYLQEEIERGREALKAANKVRAENAARKAQESRRKNANRAIRGMVNDNSSIEMECI